MGSSTWPRSRPTAGQGVGASSGLLYRTALSALAGGEGARDAGCRRTRSKPRVLAWLSPSLSHVDQTSSACVSPSGLTRGRVPAGSPRSSTWLRGHGMCSHAARSVGKGRRKKDREVSCSDCHTLPAHSTSSTPWGFEELSGMK